jgi:hypothetical protein
MVEVEFSCCFQWVHCVSGGDFSLQVGFRWDEGEFELFPGENVANSTETTASMMPLEFQLWGATTTTIIFGFQSQQIPRFHPIGSWPLLT